MSSFTPLGFQAGWIRLTAAQVGSVPSAEGSLSSVAGCPGVGERVLRAAQYVRMSTDRQQYSIASQMAVIAGYAAEHRLTIVRTYIDEGISG
ncbi:recombinase family protein [Bradyrhizobium sp. USDA 4486]